MALITCPFCGKHDVSDSGICPECKTDIASEWQYLKERENTIHSVFTCPECKYTYGVHTISGTDYHDGVTDAGYCKECGYNIFRYIDTHTCRRCGGLSEDGLSNIRTANGSSYGPYCSSCYSDVLDELYPPSANAFYDGNASIYDLDGRTD